MTSNQKPSQGSAPSPFSPLLRALGGHGLPGRPDDGDTVQHRYASGQPLSAADWTVFFDETREQRMLGLLAAAVLDDAIAVSDEQATEVHKAHVAALCADLARERELLDVVAVLDRAGLDHRVLKGSAVANLDYASPSLRSFVDVDLLVRAEEWDSAIWSLKEAGWEREFEEPRPGFDRRFIKSMVLKPADPLAGELDLHRTLALGPFGLTVRLADLWQSHEPFSLGGRYLRALPAEQRFLHACFHAALGDLPPRLVPLRDLAEMSLSGRLDMETVFRLAASWRAEAVLRRSVVLAWEVLGLDPAAEILRRCLELEPRARETRALELYLTSRRSYVGLCLAALPVIPGPLDKARYLTALAFPKRDFVASRYAGNASRWRTAAQALRRSGRSKSVVSLQETATQP
ncbi:MAG: nucleotidyltransferase family protein [Acidimicrobiales bacterium]